MKHWSRKWIASKKPKKQRKYRLNAPNHIKRKFMSAHLSEELMQRFSKRAVPLRRGDEVQVMRGGARGVIGVVDKVDIKKSKVYLDTVKRKKVDGTEVQIALQPSNLRITKLFLEDKGRFKIFERVGKQVTLPPKATVDVKK